MGQTEPQKLASRKTSFSEQIARGKEKIVTMTKLLDLKFYSEPIKSNANDEWAFHFTVTKSYAWSTQHYKLNCKQVGRSHPVPLSEEDGLAMGEFCLARTIKEEETHFISN